MEQLYHPQNFLLLTIYSQLWPLVANSGWLLCLFDIPSSLLLFWALSYVLALQDAPVSSHISPFPAQQSPSSSRSPCSFYWRMVFRNQDLNARCDHYYWMLSMLLHESVVCSFLLLSSFPFCGCTIVSQFTCWRTAKLFPFLVIINKTSINLHIQAFGWI